MILGIVDATIYGVVATHREFKFIDIKIELMTRKLFIKRCELW